MYGLTAETIRQMAYISAEKHGIPNRFSEDKRMAGKDWLAGFLKRHRNLSTRTPESISLALLTGFNRVQQDVEKKKTLLILDNHSSHCSLAAVIRARDLNIQLISFPPHSYHKLQPLDITFFSSLESEFRKASQNYLRPHPLSRISQHEIAELFTPAYAWVASMDKEVNGFRICGIFPLNPKIFTDQDLAPSEVTEVDAPEPAPSAPTAPSTSATAPYTSSSAPAICGSMPVNSSPVPNTSASSPSFNAPVSSTSPLVPP
ncbi:jerky protein homolog-like [Elysia marginata]|uniref:Jerky protein homolog-like n=1 Tax=Elysia marginata TaxID=1093978 RepID=A0AAV4HAI8_9GAST|nr:jerky protein homolog-like [Elysia marginata]